MLPNLIFLFNLLDVIPPNVQLYGKAGDTQDILGVCDTSETYHSCTYISVVILIFYP